jgi:hypothetical protein
LIYGLSAATKIAHRLNETANRDLGFSPQEKDIIFSPASLTGYLLGVWDHEQRLMSSLGGATGGGTSSDEEADVA